MASDVNEPKSVVLSKEIADRLHLFGKQDVSYRDVEESFLWRDAAGVFEDEMGLERVFFDPVTGKAYQTVVRFDVIETEIDQDVCPRCNETLVDATDIPADVICDICGWSRSGIRRCIRCGGRDDLVPDDAVCRKCRR